MKNLLIATLKFSCSLEFSKIHRELSFSKVVSLGHHLYWERTLVSVLSTFVNFFRKAIFWSNDEQLFLHQNLFLKWAFQTVKILVILWFNFLKISKCIFKFQNKMLFKVLSKLTIEIYSLYCYWEKIVTPAFLRNFFWRKPLWSYFNLSQRKIESIYNSIYWVCSWMGLLWKNLSVLKKDLRISGKKLI